MHYSQTKQEQLEEILSREEYQIYYEDHRNFLERAWDSFREWFQKNILARLFENWEASSTTGNIVTGVILFLLALVILIGLIMLIMTIVRKKKLKHYKPLGQQGALDWSYLDHLQAAESCEANQEYHAATRHLFLALLLHLNQGKWLKAQQWKTNREYYQELQQTDPAMASPFYRFAIFFEKVMYGEHQITEADYQDFKKSVTKVIETQTEMKETGEQ
ncbi:DUF4129 domain-containing protein [Gracilibacillus phocaeensis]|uniref:DUF4129 domain-containing protein n=1 Tax=Gracilibacillus phocaeensis TaxID=2042304 RepID=UPI0010320536|nr:DUF4129 domain-containing protein [Gracilibacillus phocaeensis]